MCCNLQASHFYTIVSLLFQTHIMLFSLIHTDLTLIFVGNIFWNLEFHHRFRTAFLFSLSWPLVGCAVFLLSPYYLSFNFLCLNLLGNEYIKTKMILQGSLINLGTYFGSCLITVTYPANPRSMCKQSTANLYWNNICNKSNLNKWKT